MASPMLPLPGSAFAPKYWRDETGGVLASAIYLFLNEPEKLTVGMIAYIRAYFIQWVESPAWDMNPSHDDASRAGLAAIRASARQIRTVKDIRKWIHAALDMGIDPL